MHSVPDRCPCIITGDFNIDLLNNNKYTDNLKTLMQYYGFREIVLSPTHRRGGLLDHFYINIHKDKIIQSTAPVYNSDHFMVVVAIPMRCMKK